MKTFTVSVKFDGDSLELNGRKVRKITEGHVFAVHMWDGEVIGAYENIHASNCVESFKRNGIWGTLDRCVTQGSRIWNLSRIQLGGEPIAALTLAMGQDLVESPEHARVGSHTIAIAVDSRGTAKVRVSGIGRKRKRKFPFSPRPSLC